jgi:3D (Asp-Asp-Asp) domain-containing protein
MQAGSDGTARGLIPFFIMRRVAAAIVALILSVSSLAEARPRPPRHRGPKAIRMLATAYCDRGPTKSGARAQHGVVAADIRRLPLGTRLQVLAPGRSYAGIYTVLDTGSKISGRDLDIFMASCAHARRFGKRTVQVRILSSTRKNREDRGER